MESQLTTLTSSDLQRFERDGYVVVRQAFARADGLAMERQWWKELADTHDISRDDRSPEACEARQARNERCQRPELSIAGIWRRFVPRSRILVILALELFGLVGPEPAKADQTTLVVVNDAGELIIAEEEAKPPIEPAAGVVIIVPKPNVVNLLVALTI